MPYLKDSITEERIFGTNVLKIMDFIYTNKMQYAIIRVAFMSFNPYSFYCYYRLWKKETSEQNLSKGHFPENGRCGPMNILQIEGNIRY